MKKKDIKVFVMLVIMKMIQAVIYMLGKLSPFTPHLLQSVIDNKIPFISCFIYLYYSWYIMIILIPFLYYKKDNITFKKYMISYQISIIVAFLFYFLYPTMIIRPVITSQGLSNQLTDLLYHMDQPALNCLPSMYCVLCFFHIYYIMKCKNISKYIRVSTIVWALLVTLSTLLVKQHVLVDVVFALIVAMIIIWLVENIKVKRIVNNKTIKQGSKK